MAITPARQRNSVSEGMALGLVMEGVVTLPEHKVKLDLAFEGAWRSWERRTTFPSVNSKVERFDSGCRVMTYAGERRHTATLFWSEGTEGWEIWCRRENWDPTDPDDLEHAVRMLDGDVPLSAWRSLAQDFLARLRR